MEDSGNSSGSEASRSGSEERRPVRERLGSRPPERRPVRARLGAIRRRRGGRGGRAARQALRQRRRQQQQQQRQQQHQRRRQEADRPDGGPDAPPDRLSESARAAVSATHARVGATRVNELFASARRDLSRPVFNDGFRAAGSSPWAAVLEFGAEQFTPDGRRVTWETLMFHGADLHRLFEVRPHATEAARVLREMVLLNEGLTESLASADETLTWVKLILTKGLTLRTLDPIVATAGAVLQNLRLKLGPFLRCYLRDTPVDELVRRRRLRDVRCIVTYTLVMLARIARVVERGSSCVLPEDLGDSPVPLEEYVPGACLGGIMDALDSHKTGCDAPTCRLTCSYTLVPVYMHGKYFYCNHLF
ncbi:UL54 [Suid alphaherpesvirus 1]|uniref:ICP27 n=1 Tax=Suid herpesvirus 1 TaxID=10345 RepID=G3G941_SUHV|nr:ICP27 [Suid alphaherpesvirus 1]QDM58736.1 mRNA export factor ICP27/UL54 protein [synthetic construct]SOF05916.1 UL54 [Suid alphaherpesvirus 1]